MKERSAGSGVLRGHGKGSTCAQSDNAVVEKWMHKGKMHVKDGYDSAAVLRRRHAVDVES